MPREHLEKFTHSCVDIIPDRESLLKENLDFAWEKIAAQLAKDFAVSTRVIEKRLDKDKIKEQYL